MLKDKLTKQEMLQIRSRHKDDEYDKLKLKKNFKMIHISKSSRGCYGKPAPLKNYIENYKSKRIPCEHPNHWQWGKGTRNGQKLYYPADEMFIQKWEMTEQEMDAAIKAYDMFSLEMKPRIICRNCADNILKIK
jgi:hypothetical protein